MPDTGKSLGRLVAVHGIHPRYLQRAVFISVLAFLFFLGMMFAYYIRESLGYFLLATVFLVLYLLMTFSWVVRRRNAVQIFDGGFRFGKHEVGWDEIDMVSDSGQIVLGKGPIILLPQTIEDLEQVVRQIRSRLTA